MVYFPTSIIGRVILAAIILSYISLLALNLVSFAGLNWVGYADYYVKFGLWRVCTSASGVTYTCSQWSGGQNIYDPNSLNTIFVGKPGFIKAAEGLEIVSLILYVFAGAFIIMGLIDLPRAPLEYMFGAAAILLFLCIVFISAALGVMSVQGRNNHPGAFLDWAWWIGIAGLIVTIICVILLGAFIVFMITSEPPESIYDDYFNQMSLYQQQQTWNHFMPMLTAAGVQPSPYSYQPEIYNPYYNSQNPYIDYYGMNNGQLSPVLAALARERFSGASALGLQQSPMYPYEQYFGTSYF